MVFWIAAALQNHTSTTIWVKRCVSLHCSFPSRNGPSFLGLINLWAIICQKLSSACTQTALSPETGIKPRKSQGSEVTPKFHLNNRHLKTSLALIWTEGEAKRRHRAMRIWNPAFLYSQSKQDLKSSFSLLRATSCCSGTSFPSKTLEP